MSFNEKAAALKKDTTVKIKNTNGTLHLHDDKVKEAHIQADLDIENDPYFKPHPKTHDLDEGELARFGDNEDQ